MDITVIQLSNGIAVVGTFEPVQVGEPLGNCTVHPSDEECCGTQCCHDSMDTCSYRAVVFGDEFACGREMGHSGQHDDFELDHTR